MNRVRTPLLDAELRTAVHSALWYLGAKTEATEILTAMLSLEHGAGADKNAPPDGRACWNCWCWNLGNRRGWTGDKGQYFMTAPELLEGETKSVAGGWPAWSSMRLGMVSWMELLARKYHDAWAEAQNREVDAFAAALKADGYYTATLESYTAGLRRWIDR
jgi:hypothetical protein